MDDLALVKPSLGLGDSYMELCAEEIAQDSRLCGVLPATRDELAEYVSKCEREERRGDESTCGVSQSTYWLVRNETEVVGESRLRHRLTPSLESFGGHIDYGVRASERRNGYGTLLLKITLEKARAMGICNVLVVCRKDNVASIGVIRKNGGVFDGEVTNPNTGKAMLRFRFDNA